MCLSLTLALALVVVVVVLVWVAAGSACCLRNDCRLAALSGERGECCECTGVVQCSWNRKKQSQPTPTFLSHGKEKSLVDTEALTSK